MAGGAPETRADRDPGRARAVSAANPKMIMSKESLYRRFLLVVMAAMLVVQVLILLRLNGVIEGRCIYGSGVRVYVPRTVDVNVEQMPIGPLEVQVVR